MKKDSSWHLLNASTADLFSVKMMRPDPMDLPRSSTFTRHISTLPKILKDLYRSSLVTAGERFFTWIPVVIAANLQQTKLLEHPTNKVGKNNSHSKYGRLKIDLLVKLTSFINLLEA